MSERISCWRALPAPSNQGRAHTRTFFNGPKPCILPIGRIHEKARSCRMLQIPQGQDPTERGESSRGRPEGGDWPPKALEWRDAGARRRRIQDVLQEGSKGITTTLVQPFFSTRTSSPPRPLAHGGFALQAWIASLTATRTLRRTAMRASPRTAMSRTKPCHPNRTLHIIPSCTPTVPFLPSLMAAAQS